MATPAETIRAERTKMQQAIAVAVNAFVAATGVALQRIDIQFEDTTTAGGPKTSAVSDVAVRWTA